MKSLEKMPEMLQYFLNNMQKILVTASFLLLLFLSACGGTKNTPTPVTPPSPHPLSEEDTRKIAEPYEVENQFLGYALHFLSEDWRIAHAPGLTEEERNAPHESSTQKLEDFYRSLQKEYRDLPDDFSVFFEKVVTPEEIARYYVHIYQTGDFFTDATIPENRKTFSGFMAHYPDIWNYTNPDNADKIQNGEKIPFADLAPEQKIEILALIDWGIILETDANIFVDFVQKKYPYLQETSIEEINRYFSFGYIRVQRLLEAQN